MICTLKNNKGFYQESFRNDDYLSMLVDIFTDGGSFEECIQKELIKPDGKGCTGNKTDVTIKANKVIIEPLFTENPEKWSIEIDKDVLLTLISKWQELVQKDAQEITFTRHEDDNITIEGIFFA